MPPDLIFFLHQQRRQESVQRSEHVRLVRAGGRKPVGSERAFQHLLWRVGGALFTWGCALQHAGGAMQANEKGCSVCL
jgi:hypothetical protein